jgi:hypothetical protein
MKRPRLHPLPSRKHMVPDTAEPTIHAERGPRKNNELAGPPRDGCQGGFWNTEGQGE